MMIIGPRILEILACLGERGQTDGGTDPAVAFSVVVLVYATTIKSSLVDLLGFGVGHSAGVGFIVIIERS